MSWNLSPVRPWEYWEIEADEWIEAQAVQQAYRDGQADAQDEHRTRGQQAKDTR